jgi:hypothetical protein
MVAVDRLHHLRAGLRVRLWEKAALSADARLGVLAFLVSVAFWPWLIQPATVPRWAVVAVGLPCFSRLDLGRVPVWALALGVIGFAWAAIGVDQNAGQLDLIEMAILGVAFIAGCGARDLTPVMFGFTAGAVINSAVMAAQFWGWTGLPQDVAPGGLFMNREMLAEFVAPIFVWLVVTQRWFLGFCVSLPCLLLGERAAALSVALGWLYGWQAKLWQKVLILGGIAVWGALSIIAAIPEKLMTAHAREGMWMQAVNGATILGRGLGWYNGAGTFWAVDDRWAHSDVLQGFAELGAPSLAFVALAAVAFFRSRDRNAKAVMVALFVQAAISFPLHQPATGVMFAIVAGFLAGSRRGVCDGEPHGQPRHVRAA